MFSIWCDHFISTFRTEGIQLYNPYRYGNKMWVLTQNIVQGCSGTNNTKLSIEFIERKQHMAIFSSVGISIRHVWACFTLGTINLVELLINRTTPISIPYNNSWHQLLCAQLIEYLWSGSTQRNIIEDLSVKRLANTNFEYLHEVEILVIIIQFIHILCV